MGHGGYDTNSRTIRTTMYANSNGHASLDSMSMQDIFVNKSINNAMSPKGLVVRESRDSAEHPNSVAIIIGLDVTGSMGSVPHSLVKEGLPKIVSSIIQGGEPDPQILFLGIGDHECDRSPLQVGQFESSDELLDKWLTDVYMEGGGGGNGGESYLLAWFLAANYTATDCFEKRGKKGFLFTIGDEPTLRSLPAQHQKAIMGDGQYSQWTAETLLEKVREKFNVFHIHVKFTASGSRQEYINSWNFIGESLLIAENLQDIPKIIANKILTFSSPVSSGPVSKKENTVHEEQML